MRNFQPRCLQKAMRCDQTARSTLLSLSITDWMGWYTQEGKTSLAWHSFLTAIQETFTWAFTLAFLVKCRFCSFVLLSCKDPFTNKILQHILFISIRSYVKRLLTLKHKQTSTNDQQQIYLNRVYLGGEGSPKWRKLSFKLMPFNTIKTAVPCRWFTVGRDTW